MGVLAFFQIREGFRFLLFLMVFDISAPGGSAAVTAQHHRINTVLAKEVDATLDQYLAARLIQHSSSQHSSPLMAS